MKKKIPAFLTALFMLLALLPTGAVAAEAPHLFVRAMEWDQVSMKFAENASGLAETDRSIPVGNSVCCIFYYGTAAASEKVAAADLSVTGTASVTLMNTNELSVETLGGFAVNLSPTGVGTGSVSYTPRHGTESTVAVTGTIPDAGFYTGDTIDSSASGLIAEFTVTNSGKSFYLLLNGWTYTNIFDVSLQNNGGDYVTIEAVGTRKDAVKLTVKDDANIANGIYINVQIDATETSSSRSRTLYANLRLTDGREALMYKSGWTDNGSFVENDFLQTSLSGAPGGNTMLRFYYGTSANPGDALDPAQVTFTPAIGTAEDAVTVEQKNGYWQINFNFFGSGTLQVGSYTMPVSIVLPEAGLYRANERSETNYLQDLTISEDTTIYLLLAEGWTLTSVDNGGTAGVTATMMGDGAYAEITLDVEVLNSNSINVELTATHTSGGRMNNNCWLAVKNKYQPPISVGLYWAQSDSTTRLPDEPIYETSIVLPMGYGNCIALYYYDGTQGTPVTSGVVASGPFQLMPFEETPGLYELSATGVGDGSISYQMGGNTYTVSLTAVLPKVAFFTAQTYSAEKLTTEYQYSGSGTNVLWLMSEDGFTQDQANSIQWFTQNHGALPDDYVSTEVVARGNTGVYDIKVTILNYFGAAVGLKASIPTETPWPDTASVSIRIPAGWAITVAVGGNEYVEVGFGSYDESGVNNNCWVDTGEAVFGPGGDVRNDETTAWKTFTELRLLAASEVNGVGGYGPSYLVNRTLTAEIQVNRVWIEPLTGDNDAMALSPTGAQELTENIPNSITIYAKPGSYGYARVCANVTVNGETFDVKSLGCFEKVATKNYTRSNEDTAEALNTFLPICC